MAELFLDNIYLILLLPFWVFLIIMLGRFFSVYVNQKIIYILTLLSSLLGSVLCLGALWKLPADKILETDFIFLKINDFIINGGLHVDKLSLIFALALFITSFCVQLYSISYMKNEKKKYRFFALLNLFNFSMSGLFFSPNLFQTYIFWELIGISSYLLIGYKYSHNLISTASKKVFIINRIGDTAFLSAILTCSYFIYTYAPNKSLTTLSYIDFNTISTILYAYASTPIFETICTLFILTALVKSAQFIFFTWLQDAMFAELPVSALLHSATLVASGVYLTIRLLPIYTLEPIFLKLIAAIGILTAIICSLCACAQTQPKKALAYSTSAQIGLMFFAIGILNIKTSIILFFTHAIIKSMLFLSLPQKGAKWNYYKFVLFLIGGLSLSGIILSGMVSKELLIVGVSNIKITLVSILSFLTAFYILRLALVIYENNGCEKSSPPKIELISIILLLITNICFYFYLHKTTAYKIAEPFWTAITAWICVYILYTQKAFWKIPIVYNLTFNGFYLDKLYLAIANKIYNKFTQICSDFDLKVLSNNFVIINFAKSIVKIFAFIENNIMNKTVKLITQGFRRAAIIDAKLQSGNIQNYNAYAFIILTIVLSCLIIGYTSILIYFGGING